MNAALIGRSWSLSYCSVHKSSSWCEYLLEYLELLMGLWSGWHCINVLALFRYPLKNWGGGMALSMHKYIAPSAAPALQVFINSLNWVYKNTNTIVERPFLAFANPTFQGFSMHERGFSVHMFVLAKFWFRCFQLPQSLCTQWVPEHRKGPFVLHAGASMEVLYKWLLWFIQLMHHGKQLQQWCKSRWLPYVHQTNRNGMKANKNECQHILKLCKIVRFLWKCSNSVMQVPIYKIGANPF